MIYKKHYERAYIAGVVNVHWEHWVMACDGAGCDKELETAEYDDLFDKARLAGWMLIDLDDVSAQFCPLHQAERP